MTKEQIDRAPAVRGHRRLVGDESHTLAAHQVERILEQHF
jgi:hypothetical protein